MANAMTEKKRNKSKRLEDCDSYYGFLNSYVSVEEEVHHCWDTARRCPCCAADFETHMKAIKCKSRHFVAHGFPDVSLGKMTGYVEALCVTCQAQLKNQTFPRALKFRDLDQKFRKATMADIGVGTNDELLLHNSRLNNVATFHDDPDSIDDVPIATHIQLDIRPVTRGFMGLKKQRLEFKYVMTHETDTRTPPTMAPFPLYRSRPLRAMVGKGVHWPTRGPSLKCQRKA